MNPAKDRTMMIPTILIGLAIFVISVSVFAKTEVSASLVDGEVPQTSPPSTDPFDVQLRETLAEQSKVEIVYTDYVPGDGFYIYTRVDEQNRENLLDWANAQLLDFSTEFRSYPKTERLLWILDYSNGVQSEIVVVPIFRAAEPDFYHYLQLDAIPGEHFSLLPEGILLDLILDFDLEAEIMLGEASTPVPTQVPQLEFDFVNPVLSFRDEFVSGLDNWVSAAGTWELREEDEVVAQTLLEGYDFILMLDQPPLDRFMFQTELKYTAGNGGGGVIFNIPTLGERANATVVDFAEDGQFIRWGYFDAAGNYTYLGGRALENNLSDQEWHEFVVENDRTSTTVYFDSEEIVTLENIVDGGGYVGLFASQAEVEFDNIDLARLPGEINDAISQQNN